MAECSVNALAFLSLIGYKKKKEKTSFFLMIDKLVAFKCYIYPILVVRSIASVEFVTLRFFNHKKSLFEKKPTGGTYPKKSSDHVAGNKRFFS